MQISFSKDGSIGEKEEEMVKKIENKLLSESVLESIVGKNGVSPAARLSLASRLSHLFNLSQPNISNPFQDPKSEPNRIHLST